MSTQIELAANRLFDRDALNATNIKLFPGTNRDVSAEQIAHEVNRAISQVEAGDFDWVDEPEDEAACAA